MLQGFQMASANAGKGVSQVMQRCELAKATGYLDLSDCGLLYIADALYLVLKGYEITKCNLRNNALKKFPLKLIQKFPNMIMFNIEANQIVELPSEIAQWSQMHGLNLARNKLAAFPEALFAMKKLTFLDISHNPIESIDAARVISDLPRLQQFSLAATPAADSVDVQTRLGNGPSSSKPKTLNVRFV